MRRRALLILAILLAIPLAGFVGMVSQREYLLANAPTFNVAIRAVDPRDLLRGRYLIGEPAWEWAEIVTPAPKDTLYGRLCVTHEPGSAEGRRKVRFIAAGTLPAAGACFAILTGRYRAGVGNVSARFIPDIADDRSGDHSEQIRLFVPEAAAARLEDMIVRRPGSISVDLVMLPSEAALIKRVRVDGKPLGR